MLDIPAEDYLKWKFFSEKMTDECKDDKMLKWPWSSVRQESKSQTTGAM